VSEFRVTTDRSELDLALIHQFLSEQTYWAKGISLALVRQSVANSLCFGGFVGEAQVAFARVISDYTTFGNLVDVFVLPAHRGQGYGKALMDAVFAHPRLQGLRRFTLATADAHGLYARYGFSAPLNPQSLMERYLPDVYSGRAAPPEDPVP
jgi:GNAT superfamily N-acetyltransferase